MGSCQTGNLLSANLINDVPWSAMYPIKLAGIQISPNGDKPDYASNKRACACQDDLGIYVPGLVQSMWEPARLVELVRQPNCFISMNGAEIELTSGRKRGKVGHSSHGREDKRNQTGFWHYHYYSYPLLLMLEMIVPNRCSDGQMGMDLLYLSELDATWNDPELSFFTTPEAAIFSNPIALAACITDAASSTAGNPMESLYWCAGAWGSLYPFTGYTTNNGSIATKTSLLATRAVAALHRRMLAFKTAGNEALCDSELYPTIPKQQYKMNMMYPVAESQGTHNIGESTFTWGEWRNIPSREDSVYMLWRWNDCCMTYY
ncbi:hypothetical protein ABT56_18810 [Photobacterium aquae]|uniref:Conjugal transfer protein TraU n=1 Tax=Photobacterium aquae TaxID=1195763 RepID=A0A0J1GUY7_9GAMM|nr:hypothetical protein ABT56_18810 [Photobacterium aquae]